MKSKDKTQTSNCRQIRYNGPRDSNFGYDVGNYLLYQKRLDSHSKILNRFQDIRPGTHPGINVAFRQRGTLMG